MNIDEPRKMYRVDGVGRAAFCIASGVATLVSSVPCVNGFAFLLRGAPAEIERAMQRYGEGAGVSNARLYAREIKNLSHAAKAAAQDAVPSEMA